MNADGSNKHNLTRHDGAKITDLDPNWSPDGTKIAYVSDATGTRQIWVMNGDGSDQHRLIDAPGNDRYPNWTADGKAIVFQSLSGGSSEIYRANTDGSGLVNLTNNAAVDWSPATSPHGSKVVFTSERDGNGHLYVLDRDGALQRITNGAGYDYFADWSPRGSEIVFSRDDPSGNADLYLVRSDGTGERRAAPHEHARRVRVLPSVFTGRAEDRLLVVHVPPAAVAQSALLDARDRDRRQRGHRPRVRSAVAAVPNHRRLQRQRAQRRSLEHHPRRHRRVRRVDESSRSSRTARSTARPNPGATHTTRSVDPNFNFAPTEDMSGSLRLVRSGGTTTSYFKSDGTWVPLTSAPAQPTTAIIALSFKSYGNFGHQAARVAFDDFRLDATDVDCSSTRPDLNPDWQPIVRS